jgi:hypothetical protein
VLPRVDEDTPERVVHTFTPSHFANAATTLQYVEKIIVPFIQNQRDARVARGESTEEKEKARWALLIWDNFSAHADASVSRHLSTNRIHSLFLPPRCTSQSQPLDVLINGAEKRLLSRHFTGWHFKALDTARRSSKPDYNVLPRTSASKRAFIATLIAGVHRIMAGRSLLIRTAWFKSTLLAPTTSAMDVDLDFTEGETIALDSDLLADMAQVALDSAEESIDNPEDEFTDATCSLDAPDVHDHFAELDVFDNSDDEEL